MELRSIRGGSKEALRNKEYNIGVGISLGNKWFSSENILKLIEWSLEHTKEYVVVYVADTIHAINIEIRNKRSPESARRKALRMGEEVIKEIQDLCKNKFSKEDLLKLYFNRWDDFLTQSFKEKVEYLKNKYETDNSFSDAIHAIVKGYTQGESRNFSEQDIHRLGDYIIEELPEIVTQTPASGTRFEAYAYPFDGPLPEFVEKIQKGEIFLDIKEEMLDSGTKVFLEVR